MIDYSQIIENELGGLYGSSVLKDMDNIIKMYEFYEGDGQVWATPNGLDYKPTKNITNYVKKLIKEEARFMFSIMPEFNIKAKDNKDTEKAEELQVIFDKILEDSNFKDKLIKGGRDCFIGKRVALKIAANKENVKLIFRPSLEFIYDTDPEDVDKLNKIVFFYGLNDEEDKTAQRIWKQTYYMDNGTCRLDEAIYNGYGTKLDTRKDNEDLKIDFIPAVVIINDGLTGDLIGESDVKEIMDNQGQYNSLKSDDNDALRFNMFPERVFKNASAETIKKVKVSPGGIIDLQGEGLDSDPDYKRAEANFGYDTKLENTINRAKNDMFDLLNIPNVSLEQLKGLMQSGKSMEALYWQLISRCNEKWAVWEPNLKYIVRRVLELYKAFVDSSINLDFDYEINIKLRYALPEDDQTEKENDLLEVTSQVKSKLSYIKKWRGLDDKEAQEELEQIAAEQKLFQDAFMGGVESGLNDE